jgi:hypothetical protein
MIFHIFTLKKYFSLRLWLVQNTLDTILRNFDFLKFEIFDQISRNVSQFLRNMKSEISLATLVYQTRDFLHTHETTKNAGSEKFSLL